MLEPLLLANLSLRDISQQTTNVETAEPVVIKTLQKQDQQDV